MAKIKSTLTSAEVDTANNEEIKESIGGTIVTATKGTMSTTKSLALKMKERALKKFKITVTNQDPKEASTLKSTYVSVANQFLNKAYIIPFNIPVNGIEQCIIDTLKEAKYSTVITNRDSNGQNVFETREMPKYSVVIEEYVEEKE